MIPALTNYLVTMFKETPILSVVTIRELMGEALVEVGGEVATEERV